MRKLMIAGFLGVVLLAGSVFAGRLGVTGKIGTLGLGADVTLGVTEKFNIRAGGNFFNYDFDFETGDIESPNADDVTGELKWQSLGALIDYHPFGGTFRISAGMMLNGNEIILTADSGATVELGNSWEAPVQDLTGTIDFEDFVPYFGVGVGNAVSDSGRWAFSVDLGVMFQDSPELALTGTAVDSRLQQLLDDAIAQELDDLEEDVKDFNFYPVVSIGLSYKFF